MKKKKYYFRKNNHQNQSTTTAKQVQVDKQNSKKKSVSEINDVYDRYLKNGI